jgi:succinate-acetate transporter protein
MSCAGVAHTILSPTPRLYQYFDFNSLPGLPYGLAAVAASVIHWLRFRVPITIAAFAAGLALVAVAAVETFKSGFVFGHTSLVFIPIGFAIFATAMKFDMSDRNRMTQRTDIAFWLHLLAAPLIVHSIVYPLMAESTLSTGDAISILLLFAVLSFVALAIDRRALLVSSLLYLGYASSQILTWSGVASENLGLSVLIVGGTVLALSVAWQPMRRVVLHVLPQTLHKLVPPAAKHI